MTIDDLVTYPAEGHHKLTSILFQQGPMAGFTMGDPEGKL